MFAHSLVDTLRLAFGQVVYHHKSHARAATSLARCSRFFRAAETTLLIAVVVTALGAAFGRGAAYAIAASALASAALFLFLIHMAFDFDSLARAHHVCSTRLWHVREEYRALLADLYDDAIDADLARTHRKALMDEVTAIYDSAPMLTRRIFATLQPGNDSEEIALGDEEINRFLPKSLHRTGAIKAATGAVSAAASQTP